MESVDLFLNMCMFVAKLCLFVYMLAAVKQAPQFVGTNSGNTSREHMKHRHSVCWQCQAQVCHELPSSLSFGSSSRGIGDHIRSPAASLPLFLSHLFLCNVSDLRKTLTWGRGGKVCVRFASC